jgi:hypothetical protein
MRHKEGGPQERSEEYFLAIDEKQKLDLRGFCINQSD